MVYVVLMGQAQWQGNERVGYVVIVEVGETLALGIVGIEIAELYVEDGSVHLRHAAIDASIFTLIFHMASIVGKCAYGVGKCAITCGHSTCVAHGTYVLSWIEAVCSCLSERTCFDAVIGASLCLRAVFHEDEAVAAAYIAETVSVGHASVEVHYHDALGARCYVAFHLVNVHLQIVESGLNKHGGEAIVGDGDDGGDESVSRHDDFITIVEDAEFLICAYDEAKGIEPVSHGYAMLGASVACVVSFKAVCLFSMQIPSAVDYPACCLLVFIAVHLGDGFQIKLLYHDMLFPLLDVV